MPDIFGGPTAGDLGKLWNSNTYYYSQPIAQGWECPKCGRVYSPSMVMCSYCVPKATVTTGTSNIGITPPEHSTCTTELD